MPSSRCFLSLRPTLAQDGALVVHLHALLGGASLSAALRLTVPLLRDHARSLYGAPSGLVAADGGHATLWPRHTAGIR